MPYVPPKYPGAIPTAEDLPDRTDDVDWMYAARYNELKKELRAALIELGTLPKGASADVKTRLGLLAPKASPVFTGQATIPTVDLAGGQIAFPASQSASADPNTLDDYEEGAWTPGISFGGGITGITYDTQNGYYTKIGNIVTVSGYTLLTSKGTDAGAAFITGLPFTVADNFAAFTAAALRLYKVTFANQYMATTNINTATMSLLEVTEAGAGTVLTNTNFANDSDFMIGLTYRVK